MNDWVKAGQIAKEAREYGKGLVKVDASLLEVTNLIEEKIKKLGGDLAFPVQLSRNEIAAHYNALVNDETKFIEGDLVKLDLGVSVNGAIGDTAVSVDLSGGVHQQLIRASEEALKNAIKTVKLGVEVKEIGKVIQETIQSYGFSPIKNLCGHGLDIYSVHNPPNISNFDNGDNYNLTKGDVIAIEPFVTSGEGVVVDGKPSEIYKVEQVRNVRDSNARMLLRYIVENFKTLPFAKRHLLKEFDMFKIQIGLLNLQREGIIKQYSQLREKSRAFVAQTEHSLYIDDKITVLTQ